MNFLPKTSGKIVRSIICAAAVFTTAAVCVGCKGRTASNMVPTGDTVEVVINVPTDTIQQTSQNNEI